jgi:hypothetical protein
MATTKIEEISTEAMRSELHRAIVGHMPGLYVALLHAELQRRRLLGQGSRFIN